MTKFEIYGENAYGHELIATFMEKKDAVSYIEKNPLPDKYHYFVIEEETIRHRFSANIFLGIKAGSPW